MDEFIRSFFGHQNRRRGMVLDDDEMNDPDANDTGFFGGVRIFGFMDDSFRQMEETMRGLEEALNHMELPEHPSDGYIPHKPQPHSLRDRMLKESSENDSQMQPVQPWTPFDRFRHGFHPVTPAKKQDDDLDGKVNAKDLEGLFKNNNHNRMVAANPAPSQPSFQMRSSSISSSYSYGPDGVVNSEERRTTRDGSGNEETTITRIVGDKQHIVTTKRDPQGQKEVIENLINIDKGEDLHIGNEKGVGVHRRGDFTTDGSPWFGGYFKRPQQPVDAPYDQGKRRIFERFFGDHFRK